jgi:hypothetical protein
VNATLPRADVHVAGLTADEGLVCFYFSTHRSRHVLVHGLADAMHHEPRRFLSNSKRPRYFARTNSVLTVAEHPERAHPLIQAQRRILKDGSNLESELLLASRAKPYAPSLYEGVLLRSAARARHNTIRPAKVQRVLKAAVWITKVNNGLLKSVRRVHDLKIYADSLCASSI